MSYTEMKLKFPLNIKLVNFIRREMPNEADFIISTIETTIKLSINHFKDILTSLMPLLDNSTQQFVDNLFKENMILENKSLRKVSFDQKRNSLHYIKMKDEENQHTKHVDFNVLKKEEEKMMGENVHKNGFKSYFDIFTESETSNKIPQSNQVIFNKVKDGKYISRDVEMYANKFGELESVRKISKEKYLIQYKNNIDAGKLVDSNELVLGDCNIRKYYNDISQIESFITPNKTVQKDIRPLFIRQMAIIEKLESTYYNTDIGDLKMISDEIKSIIYSYCQQNGFTFEQPVKQNEESVVKRNKISNVKKEKQNTNQNTEIGSNHSLFNQFFN